MRTNHQSANAYRIGIINRILVDLRTQSAPVSAALLSDVVGENSFSVNDLHYHRNFQESRIPHGAARNAELVTQTEAMWKTFQETFIPLGEKHLKMLVSEADQITHEIALNMKSIHPRPDARAKKALADCRKGIINDRVELEKIRTCDDGVDQYFLMHKRDAYNASKFSALCDEIDDNVLKMSCIHKLIDIIDAEIEYRVTNPAPVYVAPVEPVATKEAVLQPDMPMIQKTNRKVKGPAVARTTFTKSVSDFADLLTIIPKPKRTRKPRAKKAVVTETLAA